MPVIPDRQFRVKVCGVRRAEDLRACVDAGIDAVGWNLYPPSVRFVDATSSDVQALCRQAAELGLYQIGVFVNEPADTILRAADRLGLDSVQLHGDELPELGEPLTAEGYRVVRAIRLPAGPLDGSQIREAIGPWASLPVDLLLDADPGTGFGGGGRRLDWHSIARWAGDASGTDAPKWILAGGLSPENVADAIESSGATAVDVASGVEQPRGSKSPQRIAAFARACRAAWESAAVKSSVDQSTTDQSGTNQSNTDPPIR